MNLAGAAVVPSAPILVPGMSERVPEELAGCGERVRAVLDGLPEREVTLLLAGGAGAGAVHAASRADLGGLSRPDLAVELRPLAPEVGLPVADGPWPVDAAVLALHTRPGQVVAVSVPFLDGVGLLALAAQLAGVIEGRDVVAVASGDLSAGLSEKAPRHLVEGAAEWDASALDAIRRGDVSGLAALGPDEARRVASRGWPALVVLLALLGDAGARLADVAYDAPRGVGYVVGAT